ncbi:hypothetical protein SS05631_c37950 [Sinorhizobium sp. CCBAU 05631]|nr:hypothetical protein SS05631_c37950 [Sinorhizobium sp. CCBAU 05631]
MVHFVELVEHGTRTPCFNRSGAAPRSDASLASVCLGGPQSLSDYHFSCAVQQTVPPRF